MAFMFQNRKTIFTALWVASLQSLPQVTSVEAEETGDRPPNIVLIMADDMGYGDVHALNDRSRIPTPHLDRLAAEGMTLTDAHSPSSVCTPTRYGIVTGRYCWRTRLKRGVLDGYGRPLIEKDRPTVASVLKTRGYHTGIVGKWHLGLGFASSGDDDRSIDFSQPIDHGPNDLGFDYSHIIPASLDFPPYVFLENGRITRQPTISQPARPFPAFLRRGPRSPDLVMENCLDELTERAVEHVARRAAAGEPFLLYFPLTAPHKPVLPHARFRGTTQLGPYGDFVAQVDSTVGRVLKAIDDAGIRDRTLVLYTSDNGSFMYRLADDAEDHVSDSGVQGYRSDRHRSNHIYRGTKADIWEGGHRVPLLVRWPGVVEPGSRCDATVCLIDFFATAAEAAGASIPEGAAPDSFSMVAHLRGQQPARPRPPVVHHSVAGMFAVRDGRWKLVLGNGSGGRESPAGAPWGKPYRLYDMEADVQESKDVAWEHPEVVQRLERLCKEIIDSGEAAPTP